jgi:AraC family transcriptional regulator
MGSCSLSEGRTDLLPGGQFAGERVTVRAAPGIRFVETTYSAGQVLPRHAHEHAHFCLVLDGSYTETLDSAEVPHGPLSLLFLPERCPHGERHHTAGRHFIIELALPLADLFSDAEPPLGAVVLHGAAALQAARLYSHAHSSRTVGVDVTDRVWQLVAMSQASRPTTSAAWLRRTRDSIRDRYPHTLGLQLLAAEAGVHPVHLAQTFRRVYGRTIGEYVRELRVQHACRSLIAGRASLSEIAHEAGFADQSHLTRCFRRMMGVTPGAYRRAVGLPPEP